MVDGQRRVNAPVSSHAFRPWEAPEKLALRDRLLKCQRLAASRAASSSSANAASIYWMACDYAGRSAHATASIERLEEDRLCLVRLLLAGNACEAMDGSA
jgi:hypothetical protein